MQARVDSSDADGSNLREQVSKLNAGAEEAEIKLAQLQKQLEEAGRESAAAVPEGAVTMERVRTDSPNSYRSTFEIQGRAEPELAANHLPPILRETRRRLLTHSEKQEEGQGKADAVHFAMQCVACLLITGFVCLVCIPWLLWIIWGSIITHKNRHWRSDPTCKAEQFWCVH